MKLKKLSAFALVAVLLFSLSISVSAGQVSLYADQQAHSALDVTKTPLGVYYDSKDPTSAMTISCPSYSNNIGTLRFSLYLWMGDYESTVAEEELHSTEFVDFNDNASLRFEYPTAPAGEYLILVQSTGTDMVGVWIEGNASSAAKNMEVKCYYEGAYMAGVPCGEITTGASASLGNLVLAGQDEDPIDIGTELTSSMPPKTFEEKIADSIIMYTGSSTAFVGATTKMIDKYNKNVTPIIVNGCTMLPIRFVAENLGTSLEWDDANQIIKMERYGTTIEMKIGNSFMKLNGEPVELEVPAQILNGRTMVPLRAVVHALNIPIHWRQDGANGIIIIGETCNDLGEDYTVIGTILSKFKMR